MRHTSCVANSDTSHTQVCKALNKALASPDVIEKFLSLGLETGGGSAADLVRIMEADTNRWGPIVKASGFKAD